MKDWRIKYYHNVWYLATPKNIAKQSGFHRMTYIFNKISIQILIDLIYITELIPNTRKSPYEYDKNIPRAHSYWP